MRKVLVLAMILFLGGCASSTPYGPLTSSGGYSETQVNQTTYEIRGTVNFRTLPSVAEEYALIRAADIACQAGYPYFKVLSKQIKETQGTRSADYMTTAYLTIRFQKTLDDNAYNAKLLLRNMDKEMNHTLSDRLSCPIDPS